MAPIEKTKTRRRPWSCAASILTATALLAIATLVFATQRLDRDQRHYHSEPVLRGLATSSSIHLQFHSKAKTTLDERPLVITAVLFPRTDADSQQLTFDGRLSYVFAGHEYNFTVSANRGYATVEAMATRSIERNDCLRRDAMPPIHRLADALRDARVVDAAPRYAMDCPDGTLVQFQFAGEPYVFCSRVGGMAIDSIHGHDLNATVALVRDATDHARTIESLRRPGNEPLDVCDPLVSEEDDTREGTESAMKRTLHQAITRAKDVATMLTGRRRLADTDDDDCSTACRDGQKVCLFVHGLGKSLDAPVADTYDDAWGAAAWQGMHCCSVTKFVRMDTVNYPWYTALLANKVCDAAMALTRSADPMQLENIAIISHSMGNLIVASAAAKEICAVGPTSKWIALAGPITGSQSANVGTSTCSSDRVPLNETVHETLTAVHLCPAKRGTQSLVFQASDASFWELDVLYDRALHEFRTRVSASLCGVSSVGLASLRSAKYAALGLISGHGSPHDGAVEINSCGAAFGVDAYQSSWRGGRFYRASVNHADAALRNGDGLWGDDRKPVKWLNCQF